MGPREKSGFTDQIDPSDCALPVASLLTLLPGARQTDVGDECCTRRGEENRANLIPRGGENDSTNLLPSDDGGNHSSLRPPTLTTTPLGTSCDSPPRET